MTDWPDWTLENTIGRLQTAISAVQQRTSWSTPEMGSAVQMVLESDLGDLLDSRAVFSFLDGLGVQTRYHYQEMIGHATGIAELAGDSENSTEFIETNIWALIDEWLMHHRMLGEKSLQSALDGSLPGPLYEKALALPKAREKAQLTSNQVRELATALRESDQQSRQALAAATAADDARRKASSLAASAGNQILSSQFTTLSSEERRVAWRWTVVSIATTLTAILLGWAAHVVVPFQTPEAALLYPLFLALGLAGLAAYFARLAGHHRHAAQWARSIAVQLDSYTRFIEHTSEQGAVEVFDRFASRVLGPPPPRSEKAAVQSATFAELLALVQKAT